MQPPAAFRSALGTYKVVHLAIWRPNRAPRAHAHAHAHAHARMHACNHTRAGTLAHAHVCVHAHARNHARLLTCHHIHPRTCSHAQKNQPHMYTHARVASGRSYWASCCALHASRSPRQTRTSPSLSHWAPCCSTMAVCPLARSCACSSHLYQRLMASYGVSVAVLAAEAAGMQPPCHWLLYLLLQASSAGMPPIGIKPRAPCPTTAYMQGASTCGHMSK